MVPLLRAIATSPGSMYVIAVGPTQPRAAILYSLCPRRTSAKFPFTSTTARAEPEELKATY